MRVGAFGERMVQVDKKEQASHFSIILYWDLSEKFCVLADCNSGWRRSCQVQARVCRECGGPSKAPRIEFTILFLESRRRCREEQLDKSLMVSVVEKPVPMTAWNQ